MKAEVNRTIGILGGGQLGKMLFEAGSPMNFNYRFLEKSKDCPAGLVSHNQVVGGLKDADKIYELAEGADVLSYEIEHVNVDALETLEKQGKLVIPASSVLRIIQDKGLQKRFYDETNTPTLPYALATTDTLKAAVTQWEDQDFVLKHRKGGYDGKGVQLLNKERFNALYTSQDASLQSEDGFVVEKIVKGALEVSVIVAIGQLGDTTTYEPCEMVFDPRSNLMDYLVTPSNLSEAIAQRCKDVALHVVKQFNSAGLFAVEMFVTKENEVYVNEIAPRPHNSGHHTIESCITSQFEQLNRILLGLPVGDTSLVSPAVICNIVGPEGVNGAYVLDRLNEVMRIPGVYIHMYGKKTTSPDRKLGHFTVISSTKEEAINKMEKVKSLLTIKSA